MGDYVFYGAKDNAVSRMFFIVTHTASIHSRFEIIALEGFKQVLAGTNVQINYAEGCKLWSASEDGFPEAVAAAEKSDIAVVAVGTWSLDQTLLWSGVSDQAT